MGSGAVGVAKGSDFASGEEDGDFGIESVRDGGILGAPKVELVTDPRLLPLYSEASRAGLYDLIEPASLFAYCATVR